MKLNREGVQLNAEERNKRNQNWATLEVELDGIGEKIADSGDAKELAENVQAQVNALVVQGDSSVEARQARVDAKGVEAATLKARLDAEQNAVTQQLAEKAEKDEVRESTATQPINVSEMDTETKKLFTGGSVAVVGENSIGAENIKEKGVTIGKLAVVSKSSNLFDQKSVILNTTISATTGQPSANTSYSASPFFRISPESTLSFAYITRIVFYTESKVFISSSTTTPVTAPSNAVYARVVVINTALLLAQLNNGETLQPYEDFHEYVPAKIIEPYSVDSLKMKKGAIKPEATSFLKRSTNIFDPSTIIPLKSINSSNGELVDNANNQASELIAIYPSTQYTVSTIVRKAFYNADGSFLYSDTVSGTFTTPASAYYMRIAGNLASIGVPPQINEGGVLLAYEPYYNYVESKMIENKSLTSNKLSDTSINFEIFGGQVDFDFYKRVIKIQGVRMTYRNINVEVTQQLDILNASETFQYVLYFDTVSQTFKILNTLNVINIQLPETAFSVCMFRIASEQVEGLSVPYLINGRQVLKDVDTPVIDTNINKTFHTNVVLPAQPVATGEGTNPLDLYALYDALMAAYPTYITRTLLGYESSADQIPIYRYDFKPVRPYVQGSSAKQFKLFVSSGTHPEYTASWTLYNTMKNICNNWQEDELLEALRFNIHFVVVPIVSPWAYKYSIRTNVNGVDINRNFPSAWNAGTVGSNTYGGTAPLSEVEAQLIHGIFLAEKDIAGIIDFHNYGSDASGYYFMYGYSNNNFGKNVLLTHYQKIDRLFKKKYDVFNQDADVFSGWLVTDALGGSMGYEGARMGFKGSITYEVAYRVAADANGSIHDSNTMTFAYEAFVNFLLGYVHHLVYTK